MNIEFTEKQIIIMKKYFLHDYFKITSIKDAKVFSEAFAKIEKAHLKIIAKKKRAKELNMFGDY